MSNQIKAYLSRSDNPSASNKLSQLASSELDGMPETGANPNHGGPNMPGTGNMGLPNSQLNQYGMKGTFSVTDVNPNEMKDGSNVTVEAKMGQGGSEITVKYQKFFGGTEKPVNQLNTIAPLPVLNAGFTDKATGKKAMAVATLVDKSGVAPQPQSPSLNQSISGNANRVNNTINTGSTAGKAFDLSADMQGFFSNIKSKKLSDYEIADSSYNALNGLPSSQENYRVILLNLKGSDAKPDAAYLTHARDEKDIEILSKLKSTGKTA